MENHVLNLHSNYNMRMYKVYVVVILKNFKRLVKYSRLKTRLLHLQPLGSIVVTIKI